MSNTIPLNPAQKSAIEHGGGPALVIAGAGSGKTRVITQRIARLIEQGYPARTIFAVTFTNKASEEMAERLALLVGHKQAQEVWMSTFHALGGEIVRREAKFVANGEKFVIYDAADSMGVLREVMRELKATDKRYDMAAILARISHAKNALTTPDELPEEGEYDEIARLVFPRYQAALKRLNALDFDDLIVVPLRLLTEVAEVRERWQQKVRQLLVDEFQDTNRAQLLMVKAIAGDRREVFCVGDDDQAIYGWRGADVRNVIEFGSHFPGSKTLALEQNYRSRQPILDVANAVIAKCERAYPKQLFSDKKLGAKVQLVECDSNESETKFALETTRTAIANGVRAREIGILYRGNLLARPLEEAFRLAGVPYRLIGGTSFYERREVKDLTAYLRLAVHPQDEISFRRVVNYPTRGVGDVSLEHLERHARARAMSLFDAAASASSIRTLEERTQRSLATFVGVVHGAKEQIDRGTALVDVAKAVADAIELRADITDAGPTPAAAAKRMLNLESFYKTLAKLPKGGPAEARQALARLSLRFAEEEDATEDRVTLSTLHGSKGLEFGIVLFLGCDEGIIPHARTDAPKATDIASTIDTSEERRLFYVGVTRAKDTLYLVRARMRAIRGAPRATLPSRFLMDIPADMLEKRVFSAQAPLPPTDLAAQARALREMLAKKSTTKP